jgi:hypothetical protein
MVIGPKSYYRLPDGIEFSYQMGDEIVALLKCTIARVLLGTKKILDYETERCLDSCVSELKSEESELRAKVRRARYDKDNVHAPMTQDEEEAFDLFWESVNSNSNPAAAHKPDLPQLLHCAQRTPMCVRDDIIRRLRPMRMISSISLCRSSYVYNQVFNIYPHNYELAPSDQISPVYVNVEAQQPFRFMRNEELWDESGHHLPLPRSTQEPWTSECSQAEKDLQARLVAAGCVSFRTSAFAIAPSKLWSVGRGKKQAAAVDAKGTVANRSTYSVSLLSSLIFFPSSRSRPLCAVQSNGC